MNRENRRKLAKVDKKKLEKKIDYELEKAFDRCTCPLDEAEVLTYTYGYIDCLFNLHLVSEEYINAFLTKYQFILTNFRDFGKVNFNEEI